MWTNPGTEEHMQNAASCTANASMRNDFETIRVWVNMLLAEKKIYWLNVDIDVVCMQI